MTPPIQAALATIAAIDAGKPLDPAAQKALLWALVNALQRL